jgi:hypothetical protein
MSEVIARASTALDPGAKRSNSALRPDCPTFVCARMCEARGRLRAFGLKPLERAGFNACLPQASRRDIPADHWGFRWIWAADGGCCPMVRVARRRSSRIDRDGSARNALGRSSAEIRAAEDDAGVPSESGVSASICSALLWPCVSIEPPGRSSRCPRRRPRTSPGDGSDAGTQRVAWDLSVSISRSVRPRSRLGLGAARSPLRLAARAGTS